MKPRDKKRRARIIVTPWGIPDFPPEVYAGGRILSFSTPTHGGFYVFPELNKRIPKGLRDETHLGQGHKGWYFADRDWETT